MPKNRPLNDKQSDKLLKKIGQNIRDIRLAKGLNLEDVEEAGYPSWRHLQTIESGRNCNVKSLLNAAKALKVSPADFFKDIK